MDERWELRIQFLLLSSDGEKKEGKYHPHSQCMYSGLCIKVLRREGEEDGRLLKAAPTCNFKHTSAPIAAALLKSRDQGDCPVYGP